MRHYRGRRMLACVMSSRLAARAASSSSSRSSILARSSALASSRVWTWFLRSSRSAAVPSPDWCHASCPRCVESRFSSRATCSARRLHRSWLLARSAWSEARLVPGTGRLPGRGAQRGEQVPVLGTVEEGAVYSCCAGDRRGAGRRAVRGGQRDCPGDALAPAPGVGLPPGGHRGGAGWRGGHEPASAWRPGSRRGMPSMTCLLRRTRATASRISPCSPSLRALRSVFILRIR